MYAVLKKPPTKIALKSAKMRNAIPRAKGFAFISAFARYTAEPERRVILIITAMPMTSNEHSSIKQTKRYLPFTTSRLAKGSSAEKRMSFASRAL